MRPLEGVTVVSLEQAIAAQFASRQPARPPTPQGSTQAEPSTRTRWSQTWLPSILT